MSGPITTALERWKHGDRNAQFDLEREMLPYLQQLIDFVRRRRDNPLKPRIDSHAVVNAALKSFLSGIPKEEFPDLKNHEDARKVLMCIVRRALTDEIRFHTRKSRTPEIEEPGGAEALAAPPENKEADVAWLETFLDRVRPVHQRAIDIVKLRLAGRTNREIGEELGLAPRTVQNILKNMRQAWGQENEQED